MKVFFTVTLISAELLLQSYDAKRPRSQKQELGREGTGLLVPEKYETSFPSTSREAFT